jgi:hypothetical protein
MSNYRHGGCHTREYEIWSGMKKRCYNKKAVKYRVYGARGIHVYEAWVNDFPAFLAYMGPCPEGHSIDRIDCDGNYEPGNVRWTSSKEQMWNKQNTVYVEHEGENVSLASLADEHGLSSNVLGGRVLRYGWSLDTALKTPVKNKYNMVEYKGRTQSVAAWCRELGVNYETMQTRLRKFSVEYAFETPVRDRKQPCKGC